MYACVRLMAVIQIINAVDARVYCQDSHASSWVPFGYSCPVLCQNIINAIERLKIMDFENIIYKKPYGTRVGDNKLTNLNTEHAINEIETGNGKDNIIFRAKALENGKENTLFRAKALENGKENTVFTAKALQNGKDNTLFRAEALENGKEDTLFRDEAIENSKGKTVFRAKALTRRIDNAVDFKNTLYNAKEIDNMKTKDDTIDEKSFYKDAMRLSQLAAKTFRYGCNMAKTNLVGIIKCARKSNIDGSFLKIMTKLLNKYAHSKYKFTEDMTEVLLEKIFGENTDLRNNIFDVNKLLGYLRQALHRHKKHENRDVIALSSKKCLTLSLPGCFCKSGFVENSGQCVKPSDCYQDPLYDEYISRLVVT